MKLKKECKRRRETEKGRGKEKSKRETFEVKE